MGKEYLLFRNLLCEYLSEALLRTEKRKEFFEFVYLFSRVLKSMVSVARSFPAEGPSEDPSAGSLKYFDIEGLFLSLKRHVVLTLRQDTFAAVEEFKFLKTGFDVLSVVVLLDDFCNSPDSIAADEVAAAFDVMTEMTIEKGGDLHG